MDHTIRITQIRSDLQQQHPEWTVPLIESIQLSTDSKVENLARYIDHTALKPSTTEQQIRVLCHEAIEHGFASVCVNGRWVKLVSELLLHTDVKVCTVVGFPLGAVDSSVKAFETTLVVAQGADEVDMVISVGDLLAGAYGAVLNDIRAVVDASGNACVKVILETSLLNTEQKVIGALLAKMAGADFIKTSTGFSNGGATVEDVMLLRQTVGQQVGVKASGGIRTFEDATKMIQAGASRLGASKGPSLLG